MEVKISLSDEDILIIEKAVLRALSKWDSRRKTDEENQWLNIEELQEYLPDKPAKQTVYGWVSNRSIPFHKGPKKLRFLKSEIDLWLQNNRESFAEIKRNPAFVLKISKQE